MTSPNYVAYAPGVVFVDDVGGSGGTPFVATNFNGLRNDLATYIQNHINGVTNNHYTGDLLDATLPEVTAYANAAATNYQQFVRNDMFVTLFKQMLGGTGNLTARIATFLTATGSDMSSLFAAVTAGLTSGAANVNPSTIAHRDGSGFIPQVIGAIPLLAIQELLVQATATPSAAVLIRAGSYIENGSGTLRAYGGGTISTLAAPGAGLERFDAVYLIANPSGVVTANIAQGVAATIGTASAQITIPDSGCLLATLYMNGTTNTVFNQSTIAGVFNPGGASYILEGRVLRGGGAPADASLSMTKIRDFAPRPAVPPSLTVTVLGGGFFNSSNAPLKYAGSSFTYNGAANAALLSGTNPSLPATGFARFDGLSIDLATGLLTLTPGVPSNSGAETEPALPTAGRPVGYVHVTATTTAIYSSFAAMALATGGSTQGWIDDSYRVGAGGGTSGSSLATITPAHVVSGNDATYQDGFLGSSPIVTPNLPGLINPSGNSVQIIATQANPVKVSWNGVERRYPDPTIVNPPYLSTTAIGTGTATASGTAGYRYLVADNSAGGVKTFAITIMTALPNVATQALLATLWWDGSSSLVTVPDNGAILSINSALVNLRGAQVRWTGQAGLNSTSVAFPATMPTSAPFIVPPNARVRFTTRVRGTYHAGGTPATAAFYSWVYLDGVQVTGTQIDSIPLLADSPLRETVVDDVFSGPSSLTTPGSISAAITPGQHTLSWAYLVQGTGTFDVSYVQIQADVFRAGGN